MATFDLLYLHVNPEMVLSTAVADAVAAAPVAAAVAAVVAVVIAVVAVIVVVAAVAFALSPFEGIDQWTDWSQHKLVAGLCD